MSISGQHVKTFKDANLATVTGISLDADYPHYFFDVLEVTKQTVKLKSHRDGTVFVLSIRKNKLTEYAVIEQSSSFEKIFRRKPSRFKIAPFKGERW